MGFNAGPMPAASPSSRSKFGNRLSGHLRLGIALDQALGLGLAWSGCRRLSASSIDNLDHQG
jgi:hypothetical protein